MLPWRTGLLLPATLARHLERRCAARCNTDVAGDTTAIPAPAAITRCWPLPPAPARC